MSQPVNENIDAVPTVQTSDSVVVVPDELVDNLLKACSSKRRRARRTPKIRIATPKKDSSPRGGSPKRSRRSLEDNIDSGSEIDESSDDEDEIINGSGSNMRMVARKLREFYVYREEGQSDANEGFLEEEGEVIAELLIDVNGTSEGVVCTRLASTAEDNIEVAASDDAGKPAFGDADAAGSSAAVATKAGEDAVEDVVAGPRDSNTFSWTEDFSTFSGQREIYLNDPGPQVQSGQPVDLFLQVWDLPIITHIVEQTNKYAWQTIANLSENGCLRKHLETWEETTVDEIYRLFAVINYMSLCYRSRLDEYWTKGLLGMPEFRTIMTRNRYKMLMRFLHFVDNDIVELRPDHKKLNKVNSILTHCNYKFSSMYTPQQTLSLDESLLLWKGRHSWVQCIRAKAARFGLKTFELCEATTGYSLRSLFYTGKHSSMSLGAIDGFGNTTAKVVLKLMDGYLDMGHILVIDNWYNQLALTRYLKHRHTDVIGTMSRRRTHVPLAIKCVNESKMQRGEQLAQHCGDITLIGWKDLKLVTAISTFHNADKVKSRRNGEEFYKPKMIEFYNKHMGGVDLKDQKLSAYKMERTRGYKWYMKVFRRLLNTSFLNTYIIYSKSPLQSMLNHRQFRHKVSEDILLRYKRPKIMHNLLGPPEGERVRLDRKANHFPVHTENCGRAKGSDKYLRRRCARCSQKGIRTQVTQICKACSVALCIGKCWIEYHTLNKL